MWTITETKFVVKKQSKQLHIDTEIPIHRYFLTKIAYYSCFIMISALFFLFLTAVYALWLSFLNVEVYLFDVVWLIIISSGIAGFICLEWLFNKEEFQWAVCQRQAQNLLKNGQKITLTELYQADRYLADDIYTKLLSLFCISVPIYLLVCPFIPISPVFLFPACACLALPIEIKIHFQERLQSFLSKEPEERHYQAVFEILR